MRKRARSVAFVLAGLLVVITFVIQSGRQPDRASAPVQLPNEVERGSPVSDPEHSGEVVEHPALEESGAAASAESSLVQAEQPQDAQFLFSTYLFFLLVATDEREARPQINEIRLGERAEAQLIAGARKAYRDDSLFQRARLSAMCARRDEIWTLGRLADEYVEYSGDITANQQRLAKQVLDELDESARTALVSWLTSRFVSGGTSLGSDERRAILEANDSAVGLLQKFCATLAVVDADMESLDANHR